MTLARQPVWCWRQVDWCCDAVAATGLVLAASRLVRTERCCADCDGAGIAVARNVVVLLTSPIHVADVGDVDVDDDVARGAVDLPV